MQAAIPRARSGSTREDAATQVAPAGDHRLFRTKTFREGIETFTRTIARRLRDLCDGGEESENGTVH